MKEYYSLGEVARMLNVKFYRITYAHATNQVTEPKRIANKRAYRPKDVRELAKHFNIPNIEEKMQEIEPQN